MTRPIAVPSAIWLLAAACASSTGTPIPEPEAAQQRRPADVQGAWPGYLEIADGGERIPGTLELMQEGTVLEAVFTSPLGITAQGTGDIVGRRMTLVFRYDIECAGTASFGGMVTMDRQAIEGVFTAADCTGTLEGNFRFTRRSPDPPTKGTAVPKPLPRTR